MTIGSDVENVGASGVSITLGSSRVATMSNAPWFNPCADSQKSKSRAIGLFSRPRSEWRLMAVTAWCTVKSNVPTAVLDRLDRSAFVRVSFVTNVDTSSIALYDLAGL
jgi:hypothetical protein